MVLKCCAQKSTAKAVDGKLVISFPGAVKPVVWQMDLTGVKASALEVQDGKEDGTFALVMKTPGDKAQEVAVFSTKKQAVSGLVMVSKALESARGQIRPASSAGGGEQVAPVVYQKKSKWPSIILGTLLLLILISLWGGMASQRPEALQAAMGKGPGVQSTAPSGVPLSADEFLKGQ